MFRVSFLGPFNHQDVVVTGWRVPFLEAIPAKDETAVTVILDRRIGITLTNDEAERFLPFLADSIAVALGYACHPDEDSEPRWLPHPRPVRANVISAVSTSEGPGGCS